MADVADAGGTRTAWPIFLPPSAGSLCRARRARAGAAPAAAVSAAKEKGNRNVFLWPTPPYASYPAPSEQTETLPCQILVRAELKPISARLTFFVPETSVAHVQMPSARTTLALRFDKFIALTRDDAAAAAAAVAQRSARGAARPAPELAVQDPAHRRRRAERHDDRPRRGRVRPVHLPALRRRRQRQAHVHPARRVHRLRARPEDRRGAGRPASRDAGQIERGGRRAEGPAQAEARRDPGHAADRQRAAAARGDRAPAEDAARSDRRGAALARHDRRSAS